jgi:hypothetical protein
MPHSLYNKGSAARVHLIIDCYISENLFDLFPEEVRQSVKQEEAIFFEEEQSLPEELSSLSGTIRLPSSFLDRYPDNPTQLDWRARGQANIEGELDVQDGRLVLRVAGRETALAHVGNGEFRPLCWTRERTLTFESRAGARWILFRCRRGSDVVETARKQPLLRSAMLPAS